MDILARIKAWIDRREQASRPAHPMDCTICGDPGIHIAHGEKRSAWYCESCHPPFLRTGRNVNGFRFQEPSIPGDPR